MGEFVRLEVADGIGTIRLDRPKVNALNDQVTAELADAARAAAADDIRAVIIYRGERVFAGGADIGVLAEARYAEKAAPPPRRQRAMAPVSGPVKPVAATLTSYAPAAAPELPP